MEICKPQVNEPIRSYQIHHLNFKGAAARQDIKNSLGYLKILKFIIPSRAMQFGLNLPFYIGTILPSNITGYVVFSDFFEL